MKKLSIKLAFLAVASIGLVLTSCNTTIEVAKRQHRKGYHVSISNNKTAVGQVSETVSKPVVKAENIELAVVDSPAVDTTTTEKLFQSNFESTVASVDSPSVDTAKAEGMIVPSVKKMTIAQKLQSVRQVKKQLKQMKRQGGFAAAGGDDWEVDSDLMLILLVILAWFIAPLVVYLIKGDSLPTWFNLLLWLLGMVGVGVVVGTGGVIYGGFFAFLHALFILFRH